MKLRYALTVLAAVALAAAAGGWAAAAGGLSDVTFNGCLAGGRLSQVQVTRTPSCASSATPVQWAGQAAVSSSPSPSPSGSPSPSPSPSASPSPSPTGNTCTTSGSGACGPYYYAGIPMSNGYNTYVERQSVGEQPGTTGTVTATDPGNWSVTANEVPSGYTGVQDFANIQQLTNDWNGTGWGGTTANTPLSALSSLQVTYAESSPQDPGSVYEFAPDVWDTAAAADVMFWADTSPVRCTDNGLNSGDILGQASFGGQAWTVYHYGPEVIFILDGGTSTDPVASGTCARQSSGTIDILAGFKWLVTNGVQSGLGDLTQLNTGWEICSTGGGPETFTVSSYSLAGGT